MADTGPHECIDQLVTVLRNNGNPGLEIEDYPDKGGKSGASEIDAIAGRFAIEHTSFDGVPDKRGHDARFMKLVGGLREELTKQFSFQANITIGYSDLLNLTTHSISSIRGALVNWLREVLPDLPDGNRHFFPPSCSVPFSIRISKRSTDRPGIYFLRDDPGVRASAEKMRDQVTDKAKKLKKHQSEGRTTILLMELKESALMSLDDLAEWLFASFDDALIDGVDEVWCAKVIDSTFGEFWKMGKSGDGPFIFEEPSESPASRQG